MRVSHWPKLIALGICCTVAFGLAGCADTYYGAMEKAGVHKRDIMIDRVEGARDAQTEAQEQFSSALEQFAAVVGLQETDLQRVYEGLNREYVASKDVAAKVSARIEKVEDVAEALFEEWEEELDLYQNKELQRTSRAKLKETRSRYTTMLRSMHKAEASMEPVLRIFQDNVLFLKHNLNAQAIGSLKGEFANLQGEINELLARMNDAIQQSNAFIAEIR